VEVLSRSATIIVDVSRKAQSAALLMPLKLVSRSSGGNNTLV
jgi:hypothetical protein